MVAVEILPANSLREYMALTDTLRKIAHLSALLIPILTWVTSRTLVLIAISVITIVYCMGELARAKGRSLPIITSITLRMSRPQEMAHVIVRPIYFALGIVVALVLFPPVIAYASIIILALGDPVAALVGEKIGRLQVRRKTLEGSAAGLIASFVVASIIVPPSTALIGSAGGMLMEFLDKPDDNLTMPIVAGALMMLARLVHLTNV